MSDSGRLPRGSRLGLRLKIVLIFYVLASALIPLAHHDVPCHFKSATHCSVCSMGSSGEAAADPAIPGRCALGEAGAVLEDRASDPRSAALHALSGRAPPARG